MEFTALPAGTLLGGDFQIEAPLSAGGMGAVYVARQLSTGKQRALKVMHRGLVADPAMRERFEREAKVGAMVPSDHVVEVVGAGVDPALGVPWLAMELLSGENLAQLVAQRGALPAAEAAEILRPVCHALGAAHARGVIHRDVKPENVFLARTQSTTHPLVVKVLDFGIARVAADARTASTAAMGTPLWMAPEQTELRSHVTPASDVWALGLIAFWLLTGRPYWRAAAQPGTSVPQLMREILFEPMGSASERAAELGARASLPAGFDEWFASCLARDPAQRFQNATEAGNALLSAVLRAGPLLSVAPDPSGPSWTAPPPALGATAVPTVVAAPAPQKNLLGWVLGSAVALLALVGVAVAAVFYLYFRPGSDESSRPPIPPLTASAAPSPGPEPTEAPLPSSAPAPSVSATASGKKPPLAPAPSTAAPAPALPPYDAQAALRAVNQQASSAGFGCKQMPGTGAYNGMVTFAPTGRTTRVTVSPVYPPTGRQLCVRTKMELTNIKPYSGKDTHDVPFAVSF